MAQTEGCMTSDFLTATGLKSGGARFCVPKIASYGNLL